MKTLKVLLQEVVSGIKAWVNSNFAQESNTVHKTGNETVNGVKTFTSRQNLEAGLNLTQNNVEIGVAPASSKSSYTYFKDKNDISLGWMGWDCDASGNSRAIMLVSNKYTNNQLDPNGTQVYYGIGQTVTASGETYLSWSGGVNNNIRPFVNNNYSLGTSSNQWKSVYAQTYYYNGTAWGLDKNNWWSLAQFYAQNSIHVRNIEPGVVPSSEVTAGFRMENANASYVFCDVLGKVNTGGTTFVNLIASNKFTNGALDPNGTTASRGLQVGIRPDGTGFIYTDCGWRNNLYPHPLESGVASLGTSSLKWKTFNGLNPGALSLPKTASSNLDTTNWNLRGGLICSFTPRYDGYINVQIKRDVDFSVWAISDGRQTFRSSLMPDGSYEVMVWFPCRAGFKFEIYSVPLIDSPAEQREDDLIIQVAKIWPAEGNV